MENISVLNSTELSEDVPTAEYPSEIGNLIGHLIVHTILFLFGVPGNCFILCVYWTKTRKTSTHVLIMALAWADLCVCLLRVNQTSVIALRLARAEIPRAFSFISPFENTAIGTSIMITAVIAADRYDCVCRPNRRFFTLGRGKRAAWAAFLFACVISVPSFIIAFTLYTEVFLMLILAFQIVCFVAALVMIAFCYGNVYATIRKHVRVGILSANRDNSVIHGDEWSTTLDPGPPKTDQLLNVPVVAGSTFINQPSSSCTATKTNAASTSRQVFSAAPVVESEPEVATGQTQFASQNVPDPPAKKNIRTMMLEDKKSGQEPVSGTAGGRAQKDNSASLQRKTTRMLFITSVVFLLSWLPYWIHVGSVFASYGGARIDPVFQDTINQLDVTLYINNAVNPLIYGISNRRFRKDCRAVLRKIRLC